MTAPETMLASVLVEPGTVELRRVPVPALGAREVLVRVEAVGVCGSDTHFYESGNVGDIVAEGPVILGHETSGTIVAVGADVDPGRVGQLVAVEPQRPCRRCGYCKDGRYHLCPDVEFYAAWPVDGSFSEYAVIDDDFAFPLPPSMTAEEGAMIEPVSVALHACRRAGVFPGARVLVTGAGPIGILTAQVARSCGATEIVVSDPVANRREFALAHGATAVLDPTAEGLAAYAQHFDIYIDASGSPQAILPAFDAIRSGGTACLVGMGRTVLEVPISTIQQREVDLIGTYRYVNTWPAAIDLVASGLVDPAPLVTGRHGLHAVEEALTMGRTDPAAIKTLVVPALTEAEA
ncbi:NAD(P)-dependent alcohol dehydrogenase [Leucobacter sp. CSA1]|uniref:NAD(P)-dependent alcohol dehydrogenase n=1 Tax=Leucobacter chromiisoli TaxID=2796471 RepID=A0A934UTG3_9MICO|nr:NAD(P)-dependent alcohol dehydrogenase [Leucobacter chromiisoli]MBK0418369.1 NAD(P)-dependent alcohol dehydrogenase [Leucobacter chromiisoli]